MRKYMSLGIAAALLGAVVLGVGWLRGGDQPPVAPPDNKPAAEAPAAIPDGAEFPAIPEEYQDPAYERYVDLALLGKAWAEQDAGLLADVGLQLAEGERVLYRPHKGIKADRVIEFAIKLAAEKKDKATLERLARAMDVLGKKELAAHVATAQKLAAASRALHPAMTVSVDDITPESLGTFKGWIGKLQMVRVTQDGKVLDGVEKAIGEGNNLSKQQRDALTEMIGEARAALPKEKGPPDATVDALNKLSGATRAQGLLGVYLQDIGGRVMITYVIPGTSAWQVGLQPGDIILKVGSIDVYSISDALYAKAIAPEFWDVPFVIQTPGGLWFINAQFRGGGTPVLYKAVTYRPTGGRPVTPGGPVLYMKPGTTRPGGTRPRP